MIINTRGKYIVYGAKLMTLSAYLHRHTSTGVKSGHCYEQCRCAHNAYSLELIQGANVAGICLLQYQCPSVDVTPRVSHGSHRSH